MRHLLIILALLAVLQNDGCEPPASQVRETWARKTPDYPAELIYKADYSDGIGSEHSVKWKSPIFMRRWASRLTLKIISVRVQRLQKITVADALAEGISSTDAGSDFRGEWDAINGKKAPWDSNPWVWVIEFRRREQCESR